MSGEGVPPFDGMKMEYRPDDQARKPKKPPKSYLPGQQPVRPDWLLKRAAIKSKEDLKLAEIRDGLRVNGNKNGSYSEQGVDLEEEILVDLARKKFSNRNSLAHKRDKASVQRFNKQTMDESRLRKGGELGRTVVDKREKESNKGKQSLVSRDFEGAEISEELYRKQFPDLE